ncbi:MAG: hypothetical protein SPK76_05925 [Bacteroidales bacterium]|nr:hypothetical protein [Bacteroidales bacterium]
MAQISLDGLGEIDRMFRELGEIPFEVTEEALNAMAAVAEEHVRKTGQTMGVRDPESRVHILDTVTHTKPKKSDAGGYSDVTFSGTRTRGRTKTRNAEIAFINEYGKRGQAPRPFIKQAAEQGADAIAKPGEEIIGAWFEKVAGS